MDVLLFRHGPAAERDPSRWPDDLLRPLTPRGEARTRAAARGLGRIGPLPSRVVTSPALRARDTARILADVAGLDEPATLEALAPGGSFRAVLEFLAGAAPEERIALVGHEPDLGKLAGTLLFGAPAALPMKKAGACCIRFTGEVRAGEGTLAWFLPPRVLRLQARTKEKV